MARRKKGQGTVRQRVDGRWESWYRYTDIFGNQKTKYFTAQSKQECTNKMNTFIIALNFVFSLCLKCRKLSFKW